MTQQIAAPRLHAFLASDKNIGIVLRRGPAKRVAIFLWDVSKDRFQLGQWLKGKIYPMRSDISPDGKHFIYFAMNGKWGGEGQGAWTAVSKVPYLKALDFFPKGDCWDGGRFFLGSRSYLLNDRNYSPQKGERRQSGLTCKTKLQLSSGRGSECLRLYIPRLIRDGWQPSTAQDLTFEKHSSHGVLLRKRVHVGGNGFGQSVYWEEHEVEDRAGVVVKHSAWEWADMQSKSIVFAENGCLYRAKMQGDKCLLPKLLHDFSTYSFKTIRAPY